MPSAAELGNVILQGLSSFFNMLSQFFTYLIYVGRNETIVNASRSDYQSFWEIWYGVQPTIVEFRIMLFEPYGFIWQINNNETLRQNFIEVVSIAASNGTEIFGNASGSSGMTFLIKAATEQVPNNPEFVQNFWIAIKNLVLLMSDALRMILTYFPP